MMIGCCKAAFGIGGVTGVSDFRGFLSLVAYREMPFHLCGQSDWPFSMIALFFNALHIVAGPQESLLLSADTVSGYHYP